MDSKFVAQVKHQRHAGGPQLGLQALGVALLAHAAKHVEAPLRQQGSRRAPEAGRGARDDCRPRMVEHARCSGAAVELPARQLTGLWPVTAVLIWRLGDSAGGNRHLQLLIGPHMACQPKNWRWRRWLAQEGMHSAGTAQRAPSTAVQQSDELAVLQLNPGSLDWSRAEAGALQSEGGAICDNRHWHVVVGHLACPLRRPGHMKCAGVAKGVSLASSTTRRWAHPAAETHCAYQLQLVRLLKAGTAISNAVCWAALCRHAAQLHAGRALKLL